MAAHDAFLTYAWSDGNGVASTLQQAIRTIGKPWYRRSALSVYRDTTDTEPSGSLRSDLFAELDSSRYLILLASRRAARSRWVEREVGYWLNKSGTDRLLLVLVDGEIHWGRGDFDWSRTDCLPRALSGRYAAPPPYVDLRWAVGREDLSVHDPDFRSEAATLTATILGTSKRELLSADVAAQRRARRTGISAILALSLLLVVALVASTLALVSGRGAASDLRRADADLHTAAAQAMLRDALKLRGEDPGRALQLGVAAQYLDPGAGTQQALTETLRVTPFRGSARTEPLSGAILDPDGPSVLTRAADGTVSSWSLDGDPERQPLASSAGTTHMARAGALTALAGPGGVRLVASAADAGRVVFPGVTAVGFTPDGRTLATGGTAGQLQLWDVSKPAAPVAVGDVFGGGSEPVTALAFSSRLLAYARSGTVRLWSVADPKAAQQVATIDDLDGVVDLTFSPDGRRLAVASATGVQVIDVAEPSAPGTPQGVSGARYGTLAWSPDGRRLAGGGPNGTVTTWDPERRTVVLTVAVQKGEVRDVAFDRTSATLFSAGSDGSVLRWDATPAVPPATAVALISDACRRAGGGLPRDVWTSYAPGIDYRDTCRLS
ncbi:toll/interleukin-1 receptor domain-containing protein [Cryptosporangium phraense]|uniref:TIR domain-containing protein n=1 Tax=Cryptosporangium phraense TaxID=2593070 RepID=A0A545AEL9_9ACTN|nr:TIR domain-containing protein [Cryptosporangium phraense]TQS39776.1 TIR domain-containing protein [Cryptosporangium phraense]